MHKVTLPPNMPKTVQSELVRELSNKLQQRDDIHGLISRGSFSKGLSDKYSDVDLVLIISNDKYEENIVSMPELIGEYLDVVTTPGWYDTNVPDFGGMGYVFLVEYMNKVVQLDIYSLPVGNSSKISQLTEKVIMYDEGVNAEKVDVSPILERLKAGFSENDQIMLDVLLHFFMLSKYLARKDVFLASKYWHLLHSKILLSLRYALEPDTYDYMYYDVHRHLDKYKCVQLVGIESLLAEQTSVLERKPLIKFFEYYENLAKEYFPREYKNRFDLFRKVQNTVINEES